MPKEASEKVNERDEIALRLSNASPFCTVANRRLCCVDKVPLFPFSRRKMR